MNVIIIIATIYFTALAIVQILLVRAKRKEKATRKKLEGRVYINDAGELEQMQDGEVFDVNGITPKQPPDV